LSALGELGGYVRADDCSLVQHRDLEELCCNFFSEPRLVELVESSSRIRLLQQWGTQVRLSACEQGAHFVVASHPLLCAMVPDLPVAWGAKIKFVAVDRDVDEASVSLQNDQRSPKSQATCATLNMLRARRDRSLGRHRCHRVPYFRLRAAPHFEIQRLAKYLRVTLTDAARVAAVQSIKTVANECHGEL
jgi:hypothetical protein